MPSKSHKEISKKTLKSGLEFEMFTLDSEGRMIDGADKLIRSVKKLDPKINLTKEVGKNMVELVSFPDPHVHNVMFRAMTELETVMEAADKENTVLYTFGTYPGAINPTLNQDRGYKIKEQIFGKTRVKIATRCAGMHYHYTLPWGVFDVVEKMLKPLINSKNKQSLVNTYNLFIAMDPALTTFLQSSPFYQGKFLGKDSRVIVYRGGKILNYPDGLYSKYQNFGMLQPYKVTGTDLIKIISDRFEKWESNLQQLDINLRVFMKHGSILDTTWNPVKINAHGTFEQRGMDMNHPRIIIAMATCVQYISAAIQEKFIQVMPSDIGMTEPFKLEHDTVFIPPHSHVRFDLQPAAAYKGLEDPQVLRYCQGLLKLSKQFVPKSLHEILKPLDTMVKTKKTVSDKILADAKKIGIKLKEKMSSKQAAQLALMQSKDLYKEIIMTKKLIKKLEV